MYFLGMLVFISTNWGISVHLLAQEKVNLCGVKVEYWQRVVVVFREKGNWWRGKNSMNVLLSRERRVTLSHSYSAYAWAGAGSQDRNNREDKNRKRWMDWRIEFRIHLRGLYPFLPPLFFWNLKNPIRLKVRDHSFSLASSLSLSLYIYKHTQYIFIQA